MARKATGQVIPPKGKQRSWAIRFSAYGKRRFVSLGRPHDGWTRQRAEQELENVLADVRRGIWQPHRPEPVEAPTGSLTFHDFASEWFERHRQEWRDNTAGDYEWALTYHLLPFFAKHSLAQITVEEVDRYKTAKLREGNLNAATINKTLTRLGRFSRRPWNTTTSSAIPPRGAGDASRRPSQSIGTSNPSSFQHS